MSLDSDQDDAIATLKSNVSLDFGSISIPQDAAASRRSSRSAIEVPSVWQPPPPRTTTSVFQHVDDTIPQTHHQVMRCVREWDMITSALRPMLPLLSGPRSFEEIKATAREISTFADGRLLVCLREDERLGNEITVSQGRDRDVLDAYFVCTSLIKPMREGLEKIIAAALRVISFDHDTNDRQMIDSLWQNRVPGLSFPEMLKGVRVEVSGILDGVEKRLAEMLALVRRSFEEQHPDADPILLKLGGGSSASMRAFAVAFGSAIVTLGATML